MVKGGNNSRNVVLLRDLAPRKVVVGGTDKVLFGQRQDRSEEAAMADKKTTKVKVRDLSPTKPIRGGRDAASGLPTGKRT